MSRDEILSAARAAGASELIVKYILLAYERGVQDGVGRIVGSETWTAYEENILAIERARCIKIAEIEGMTPKDIARAIRDS